MTLNKNDTSIILSIQSARKNTIFNRDLARKACIHVIISVAGNVGEVTIYIFMDNLTHLFLDHVNIMTYLFSGYIYKIGRLFCVS